MAGRESGSGAVLPVTGAEETAERLAQSGVLGGATGLFQGFKEVVQLLLIGHRGIRFASL